jgi:hypothetical protein
MQMSAGLRASRGGRLIYQQGEDDMRLVLGVMAMAVMTGTASAQKHLPADPLFCDPRSNPYDAVTAAPDQHAVLFEDSHVRVLEIMLPPLAVEPVHIHALPSVITGDSGGGAGARFVYIEFRMDNGTFVEISRREIEPSPGERTVWSPPEGPHAIANVGPVPVRFMRIEIKPETCTK